MKHRLSPFTRSGPSLAAAAIAACLLAVSTAALAASIGGRPVAGARAAAARPGAAALAGVSDASKWQWQGGRVVDWLIRQEQWHTSVPQLAAQRDDADGANCGINQGGPVWFLHSPSPTPVLNCTVPAGKPILATILVGLNDYPCPDPAFEPAQGQSLEAFLSEFNASIVDTVTLAEATLDGRPLRVRRVQTGVFPFTAAADQVAYDACFTGSPQLGQADGYLVLIDPLPRGSHVLRLRGAAPVLNDGVPFEDTYLLKVGGPEAP